MLLFKEIFRKKTIRIYFLIFIILFLGITIFFLFADYYERLYNESTKKNSAFIMFSEKDHYEELVKKEVLFNIERGLVFKPDYDYKLLGRQGTEVRKDGKVIFKKDSIYGDTDFFWEEFSEFNENIVIFKASNRGLDLSSGEIALGYLPNEKFSDENLSKLLDKKLGFEVSNYKIEFTISDFYKSNILSMAISDEDFEQFIQYSNLYFYKASVNDLKEAEKLERELKRLEKNNNYKVALCVWEDTEEENNVIELSEIVGTLGYITYSIFILFIIVFHILLKNIIKDEVNNIMLKRMIGFTKWKTLIILILQLLLLVTSSLIISLIFSKISIIAINKIFLFELRLNSLFNLLLIYLSIVVIILINCLLNRNLKEIVRHSQ